MKRLIVFVVLVLSLTACDTTNRAIQQSPQVGSPRPLTARNLQIVTGQMLYVPAYSQVFYGSTTQTLDLAVTMTVHNTDLDQPIILQSVRYYNTDGEFMREYVEEPVELPPLATVGYVVPDTDLSGGWGANFIVEWGAETPVHEPIVEAVMVSTRGTQGISFISSGRILSQTLADPDQ